MRLRITHLLAYEVDGVPAVDALAETATAGAGRLFVPGALPCGECPACRRGLIAVCPALRRWHDEASATPGADLDLPDRFLTPLDDVPDLPALGAEAALLAGPVALALQALALASATPGDLAVWLGADPLAGLGARVAAGRGLRAIGAPLAPVETDPGAAATSAHGPTRSQRHIVLTRSTDELLAEAFQLAEPGGTVTALGAGPLHVRGPLPPLPGDVRLLRTGAYHPDLVPEALALLRREKLSAVSSQRSASEPQRFQLPADS